VIALLVSVLWLVRNRRGRVGLFTALQLDALILARNLREFDKEMGPRPQIDWNAYQGGYDGEAIALTANTKLVMPWLASLRSKYALRYKDNAETLYHRFSEVGMADHHLASLASGLTKETEISDLADTLTRLALDSEKLDKPRRIKYTFSEIRTMPLSEQRALLMAKDQDYIEAVRYYYREEGH
jgi:hypothetical protein